MWPQQVLLLIVKKKNESDSNEGVLHLNRTSASSSHIG